MTVYVMLTVDLNRGVSDEARQKFYDYLAKEQWTRLKLTTTFWARFAETATPEGAINATKKDVNNAASSSGISYYEAAAEVGSSTPSVWNQSS
ncbi:hypothetical protein [uncultured Xanthomonas sp.]|uniref:hypothetical protein n=1 Tax=uncultured Xanthomonas sp. TaxID=152831 RepID=UPI0025F14F97|nr:hypothetical protein [uncultured Xanthomonas sp.]